MANSPTRIAHVLNGQKARGAEKFAIQLSEALRKFVPRQDVIAMNSNGCLRDDFDDQCLTELKGRPLSFRSVWETYRFLKTSPNLVIIAHGYTALKLLAVSSFFLTREKKPYIIYKKIGETLPWIKKFQFIRLSINRFFLHHADVIVVLGAKQHRELEHILKGSVKKIVTIPNGRKKPLIIKTNSFKDERGSFRIAMLGSLTHEKNVDVALKIVASIKSKGLEVSLDIIGDGPLRHELEKQVNELEISDSVYFYGHLRDPYSVLVNSDILLLCSATEGFPGVIIEAAMLKLTVVCWEVGEIREIVEHNRTGICVEYEDVEALEKAIELVMNDKDLCNRLAVNSYENALKYDIDIIAEQYFTLTGQTSRFSSQ